MVTAIVLSRRRLGLVAALVVAAGACRQEPLAASDDGTMLSPYLAIGERLADDRITDVPQLAAQIVAAAQTRSGEAGVDEILAAAGRLASPDIASLRLAYRKLSEGMIAWLATHPEARSGLELVHCPMTFADEGAYWVQRSGKIANPYEGAMMLRCGSKIGWSDHRRGAPPAGDAVLQGMD